MNVYIVLWYDTGSVETTIWGVFSTKEKAETFISEQHDWGKQMYITEWTIDDSKHV